MKSYNNFKINENLIDDKNFLLSHSYIDINSTNNKLKIKTIRLNNYVNDLLYTNSQTTYQTLTYSTLFRFMWFAWLYAYKGDNELVLNAKILKDDETKRILDQFANNNTILWKYVSKYIGTKDRTTEDYTVLATMMKKKNIIFTENNFITYFNVIKSLTDYGNKSESLIINYINSDKIPTLRNATKAKGIDDRNGIDIIAYYKYKNQRKTIQVKRIGNNSIVKHRWNNGNYVDSFGDIKDKTSEYIFEITNTTLDLNNYSKWEDGSLPYNLLFLHDEKNNVIYSINTNSINTIRRDKSKRQIFIILKIEKEWFDKLIKIYNI